MLNYFKESVNKFKKDALSKVFYDLLKYTFLTFGVVTLLSFIPFAKVFLLKMFQLPVWSLLILILIIVTLTAWLCFILFNRKYKQLLLESHTDELTGLKNTKALSIDLNEILRKKDPEEFPLSLILIDIDNFKKLNDDFGTESADKVIEKIGHLLQKDGRITDETYRYFVKGDEFLTIAKQTNISNAEFAAERKRKLIEKTLFLIGEKEFQITVCCGVTEYNGESKDDLLKKVTNALSIAKKNPHKNKVELVY